MRLTAGTTYGPTEAGVRSIAVMPAAAYRGAAAACTLAEVASNTTSGSSGRARSHSSPSADASRPSRRARSSPSLAGSMPTMYTGSTCSDRNSLYIRSVPMFPDPTIAAFNRLICGPSLQCRGDAADARGDPLVDGG